MEFVYENKCDPAGSHHRNLSGLPANHRFNYGAKQYDRVRGVYKLAIQCNLVISLIGFLLFQLCPRQIISLFGTGDALYFEFCRQIYADFPVYGPLNGTYSYYHPISLPQSENQSKECCSPSPVRFSS